MRALENMAKVGLVLALVCVGAAARAQSLQRLDGEQSNGIKIGDGRLHVSFDYEALYDSAALLGVNQCGANTGATALCPEIENHFRPGFNLIVPESWVNFNLGGNLDYIWYTGLLTHGDSKDSRLEGGANLAAAFNRPGAVEVDVTDSFARSDRPTDPSFGIGVLSLYNQFGIAVPIHPGGGALEVTPRASIENEYFTSIVAIPNGAPLPSPAFNPSNANYLNLMGGLTGQWKFLPKTAVIVDANIADRTYSATGNADALLLRAQAGLAGLLTSRIALTLKAGWGIDFGQSNGSTFIGMAEATYLLNAFSSVKVGVLRDIQPVSTYGTVGDLRGYAEGHTLLGGHLQLHAMFAYDYLNYYTPTTGISAGQAGRTDSVISADIGPQYQFLTWLIGSVGYIVQWRDSNIGSTNPVANVTAGIPPIINYVRNQVYLRITFTY